MTNEEWTIDAAMAEARRHAEAEALASQVRKLIDAVNYGESKTLAEAILDALNHSHRTLQQAFMSAVKLAIHAYAQQQGAAWVDPRNQDAKKWAAQVAALRDGDMRFPYL